MKFFFLTKKLLFFCKFFSSTDMYDKYLYFRKKFTYSSNYFQNLKLRIYHVIFFVYRLKTIRMEHIVLFGISVNYKAWLSLFLNTHQWL